MEFPDPFHIGQEPQEENELPEPNEPVKRKTRFGFYRRSAQSLPGATNKEPKSSKTGKAGTLPTSSIESLIAQAQMGDIPEEDRKAEPDQNVKRSAGPEQTSGQAIPPRFEKDMNPGRRLHAMEEAAKGAPPSRLPWKYRLRPSREATRRAYWDVSATLSLIVNAILLAVVVIMALQIRNLKSSLGNLMGGLYGNFAKMDQSSINTTIAVDAQVPLDFNLPITQNTDVVLTGDVIIPRAHVIISTGGLNINSLASVTLPAGTSLPITLNLSIPVQSTIPVNLQIPINIPLNQTDLHEPFTGLQTTLRRLYCTFDNNAQYPAGTYICVDHDSPTPTTP